MSNLFNSSFGSAAKIVVAALVMLGVSSTAFAATSASHIIRNTVTVDYQDPAGGTFDDTAFVDVTTQLVASAVNASFDAGSSDSLDPVSLGETVNLVYVVDSTANGVDTYDVTPTATGTPGTLGGVFPDTTVLGGVTAASAVATFETGTSVGVGNGTSITVPADDDGTDNDENGFAVGDTIVLNTSGGGAAVIVCTVIDVDDSGSADPATQANATAVIEVEGCSDDGTGGTLAIGDQIGERKSVTVAVSVSGTAGSLDIDVDFTSQTDPGETTAVDNTLINVVAADLQIYKFVRNISGGTTGNDNATCGAAAFSCVVVGGTTYFSAGVTAAPGEQLEYIVLLYNAAGTVENVVVTDPVVAFTTYEATSIKVIPQGTAADGAGTCLAATNSGTCTVTGSFDAATNVDTVPGTGGDFGGITGANILTIAGGYAPGGATTDTADEAVGGNIDPGAVSVVRYLINVD